MAGYVYRDYAVPGLSESWHVTASGSLYGSWSSLSSIPVPATSPFFAVPMLKLSSVSERRDSLGDWWDHDVAIQFADASNAVRLTFALAQFLTHGVPGGTIGQSVPGTYSVALTKARLAITSTRFGVATPADVAATLAAGKLRVYYWATAPEDFPIDTAAQMTAQGLTLVGLALSGRATRVRYRVAQTVEGDMAWSGSPVGDTLRRFT